MNNKLIIPGHQQDVVRQATVSEVLDALNQKVNSLENQLRSLEQGINIWCESFIEVAEEMLPGFQKKYEGRRMCREVRVVLINRDTNRQRGSLEGAQHFSQQLERLRKLAKEKKLLSHLHKGERLYLKWVREQQLAEAKEKKEAEDAPTESNDKGSKPAPD